MTVDSGYSNRFTLCRGCTLYPPHSIHPPCVSTDHHTSVCGSRIIDLSFPLVCPSTGESTPCVLHGLSVWQVMLLLDPSLHRSRRAPRFLPTLSLANFPLTSRAIGFVESRIHV